MKQASWLVVFLFLMVGLNAHANDHGGGGPKDPHPKDSHGTACGGGSDASAGGGGPKIGRDRVAGEKSHGQGRND